MRPLSRKAAPQPPAVHFSLRPHGGRRERGGRGTVRAPPQLLPRTVGSSGRRKALWERGASFPCLRAARSVVLLMAGACGLVVAWDLGCPQQPLACAPFSAGRWEDGADSGPLDPA